MRDMTDLLGLKNTSPAANAWRAFKDSLTHKPPAYDMNGLVTENWFTWFRKNMASLWSPPYAPYPYYSYPEANNGIFKMNKPAGEPIVIALLADWASDTAESRQIAAMAGIQDYSIHLGDTYYVGNSNEMAENFDTDQDGTWPYGKLGSFAIPGNHEMYSGGTSYFTELLPYMGLYTSGQEAPEQVQQAGFFCLENENWRIIALDTGYNSLTGMLGITPNIALELRPEQQDWLTNVVCPNGDKRGIILLSHHQCWSAFEQEFPNPAGFISSLFSPARDILWLWGHEHWFAIYGPLQLPNGANVFARCIGNSGMPVELNDTNGNVHAPKSGYNTDPANRNLVLYDKRLRTMVDGDVPLGHNGYALLTLNGPDAWISYYDDTSSTRPILEETWTCNPATGALKGTGITDHTAVPGADPEKILSLFGDRWSDAITPSANPQKAPFSNP